jgi:hypothetical protein
MLTFHKSSTLLARLVDLLIPNSARERIVFTLSPATLVVADEVLLLSSLVSPLKLEREGSGSRADRLVEIFYTLKEL